MRCFDLIGYDATRARGRRRLELRSWSCATLQRAHAAALPQSRCSRARSCTRGSGLGFATEMPIGAPSPSWMLDGGTIAAQVLASTRRHARLESPQHYPWDDLVESTAALIWVPPIPGYGTHAFSLENSAVVGDRGSSP